MPHHQQTQYPSMPNRATKTIAVISHEPAAGKTTLTLNLAHTLSKQPNTQTCVVDTNTQQPGITPYIGNPNPKTTQHLTGNTTEAVQQILQPHPKGFHTLLAHPDNPPDPKPYNTALPHLKTMFTHILIDTATPDHPLTSWAVEQADTILVVTTPNPTSLTDTITHIQNLVHRYPDKTADQIKWIINKRKPAEHYDRVIYTTAQTFEQHPLIGVLDMWPKWAQATNKHRTIIGKYVNIDTLLTEAATKLTENQ